MPDLHIYPDGSRSGRPRATGGGVAIQHPHNTNRWKFLAYSFHPSHSSDEAECLAFLRGLEKAVSMTRPEEAAASNLEITTVILHTDSQAALILLNKRQDGVDRRGGAGEAFLLRTEIADGILACMLVLDARGVGCEADWVKGHVGNLGNEFADRLAKFGAERCGEGEEQWGREFVIEDVQMRGLMRGRGLVVLMGDGQWVETGTRMGWGREGFGEDLEGNPVSALGSVEMRDPWAEEAIASGGAMREQREEYRTSQEVDVRTIEVMRTSREVDQRYAVMQRRLEHVQWAEERNRRSDEAKRVEDLEIAQWEEENAGRVEEAKRMDEQEMVQQVADRERFLQDLKQEERGRTLRAARCAEERGEVVCLE